MTRRLLLASVACLIFIAFSTAAFAAVAGSWDVSGVVKVTASAKGAGRSSDTQPYTDTFTFGGDGSFGMLSMGGTYAVNKNKFTVDLSNTDIENYMSSTLVDAFTSQGLTVEISNFVITKENFKGTEKLKDGTIKGTIKFGVSMDIYVVNYGISVPVKAKADSVFLGTRQATPASDGFGYGSQLAPIQTMSVKSLAGAIRDEILRSVSSSGLLPR